jgi:hypothetical protein
MTTDHVQGTGCPEPYLGQIAAADFTHIHWRHQWNTDFLYAEPEVEQSIQHFHSQDRAASLAAAFETDTTLARMIDAYRPG